MNLLAKILLLLLAVNIAVKCHDDGTGEPHDHSHDDQAGEEGAEEDTGLPSISLEQFEAMIENKESSLDVLKMTLLHEVFANRHSTIDRPTYTRLLIALLSNADALPSQEEVDKRSEAPADSNNMEWFIKDLVLKYVAKERADLETISVPHLHEDIFGDKINSFFNSGTCCM